MAKVKKIAEQEVKSETPITKLEPVQLTIADLQLLNRVVDLASRRGAFQAVELSQVGAVFDKLSGFLAYVDQEQSNAQKEAAETAPVTE